MSKPDLNVTRMKHKFDDLIARAKTGENVLDKFAALTSIMTNHEYNEIVLRYEEKHNVICEELFANSETPLWNDDNNISGVIHGAEAYDSFSRANKALRRLTNE